MALIEVEHLTKSYTTYKRGSGFKETMKSFFKREAVMVHAVQDVSFHIEKGEICGVLGPNGAGKSTTIKMLCGALYPTSGKINVMGWVPARDRRQYVKNIGAVFGQKSQLIWDIPPIDSFAMNQAIYDIEESVYKERLGMFSELFEVQEVMHKPTRVLSLGERMKCEFIMAMLHAPEIVFLDEPTIGLDVIAKAKIREFIKEMNQKGTTFILTTHDLEDVEQLASHVVIINHGSKVFDDSLDKLRSTLGDKKIIELTLAKPFTGAIEEEAVQIMGQDSPYDLRLEVDVAKTSIHDFLQKLSRQLDFTDIAIKELPMEQIITRIYENK